METPNNKQKTKQEENVKLLDVSVIRVILVVLLVLYHAFAIYGGSWPSIPEFPRINAYWWLDWFFYACMLETFVFVSGYVFGHQVRSNEKKRLSAKQLFPSKFRRLIIPSIIFSFFYILIFEGFQQPLINTLYLLISGEAHMWFLPMLFWCFTGVWVIERINLSPRLAFSLCVVMSLISVNGLPLQLSHTLYYMVFFYAGYSIRRFNISLDKLYTSRNALISTFSFVILFIIGTYLHDRLDVVFINPCITVQTIKFILGKAISLIVSGMGIVMLLSLVNLFLKNNNYSLPYWVDEVGCLCFGVYLLQQFILHGLYYCSSFPYLVGPYWLPWLGFLIALLSSLIITWILRLSSIGKAIL